MKYIAGETALVVMAAGIGSRFGGGIKQLEPVGPNGEIIMDYSVHDAIEAGFTRVIFIIRKDIEKDFHEIIGQRIEKICAERGVQVSYAFQAGDDLPEGFVYPEGRTKPWGTGQAVLACREIIHEPFVVINADDYYGKEGFRKLREFLLQPKEEGKLDFCMAGFILKNTLSENGGVTRGICVVDENDWLTGVKETSNLVKTENGAGVAEADCVNPIDENSHVSMNMWGLTPELLPILQEKFVEFLSHPVNPLKDEFLLPIIMDQLLKSGTARVKVIETQDKWFGVTYREDKPLVVQSFQKLIEEGVYAADLYSK